MNKYTDEVLLPEIDSVLMLSPEDFAFSSILAE